MQDYSDDGVHMLPVHFFLTQFSFKLFDRDPHSNIVRQIINLVVEY